jgi:hypothetical protein
MKIIILTLFSVIVSNAKSQNFFRDKYNEYFPNNKSIQFAKLVREKDSLVKVNDSLQLAQINALDRINYMKKELVNLKSDLYIHQENSKITSVELEKKLVALRDSISILSFPFVSCKEEVISLKGKADPTLVNTCFWRSYKIIETGTPDYKGRYTWETEVFLKNGDSLVKKPHIELFKPEKISQLEKLVNDRLSEDFSAMKISDPECFAQRKYYPNFKLKDMRLSFNDDSDISFEVEYNLIDACFALNLASTNFKILELKDYFVE